MCLLFIDYFIYDVASYLSTKYELIAYSNWFVSSQTDRLRKAGILKFFSKIYGWDILPLKPSKQAIELIVGNDNIRDYIFIGDNIDTDLIIPDSLGINTIFYNRKRISQDKYKLSITSEELYSAIGCVEKDVKDTLVTKSFLIDFLNKRLSINMNEEKLDSFMNFYLDIPLIKIEEVYDVKL